MVLPANLATNDIIDETWVDAVVAELTAIPGRFPGTTGSGAPGGTGTNGQWYYDTTNKRTYQSDGAGWIVMSELDQTYTPTLTGVTLGTPGQVNTGTFKRCDGRITLKTTLTLGTGGSFAAGTPTVALPAGITAGAINNGMVTAWMYDVAPSALQYQGVGEIAVGGGVIYPRHSSVSGTSILTTYSTNTAPFTWAPGDSLVFFGTFPMNTRYM